MGDNEPDQFQWDYSYFKWQEIPHDVRKRTFLVDPRDISSQVEMA